MENAQETQQLKITNTTRINGYVLFTQIKQKLKEGENANTEIELSDFFAHNILIPPTLNRKPMSNKKAALLAGMLAATMAEQERKDYFEFTNPYAGLEGLTYSGSGQKSYSKSPMTNKQKKSRAASKRAKQARKRGR
jgi:hypothetical protein